MLLFYTHAGLSNHSVKRYLRCVFHEEKESSVVMHAQPLAQTVSQLTMMHRVVWQLPGYHREHR